MISRFTRTAPFLLLLAMMAPLWAQTDAKSSGPFGLEAGMTKEEVIRLLGPNAIEETDGPIITFRKAPKPHPDFDFYMLTFSPKSGLVKITAAGKTIVTDGAGTQVQSAFKEIEQALIPLYGLPEIIEWVSPDTIWKEPRYWMMSLLKKDRKQEDFWLHRELPHKITGIALEAFAQSSEKGFLLLEYEFEGWAAYSEEQKAKKNSVF